MPTEEDRRYLYDEIARSSNPRAASILMEYLPAVGWLDIATKTDLAGLRAELKGDFARLEGKIEGLEGRLFAKLVFANVGAMFGFGGLIITAAALLR